MFNHEFLYGGLDISVRSGSEARKKDINRYYLIIIDNANQYLFTRLVCSSSFCQTPRRGIHSINITINY